MADRRPSGLTPQCLLTLSEKWVSSGLEASGAAEEPIWNRSGDSTPAFCNWRKNNAGNTSSWANTGLIVSICIQEWVKMLTTSLGETQGNQNVSSLFKQLASSSHDTRVHQLRITNLSLFHPNHSAAHNRDRWPWARWEPETVLHCHTSSSLWTQP